MIPIIYTAICEDLRLAFNFHDVSMLCYQPDGVVSFNLGLSQRSVVAQPAICFEKRLVVAMAFRSNNLPCDVFWNLCVLKSFLDAHSFLLGFDTHRLLST